MKLKPAFIITVSFFVIIFIGAILLWLPISSNSGVHTNLIDAFFVSNSATCTTALTPIDLGKHFSLFGILVILALMQIGGLGYMTFSTFLMVLFRKKMFISEKLMIQETLHLYSTRDAIIVMKKIFGVAFLIEAVGAAVLFIRWLPEMGIKKSILYSVFHAVSAFCNAGLNLFSNFSSLTAYRTDLIVNIVVITLAIFGGLGFLVMADLLQQRRFSLHSKIVLWTTLFLLLFGTFAIFGIEYLNSNTLGNLGIGNKFLASFLHSVSSRAAGFHTLPIEKMLEPTLLILMVLMFIGASPGGCGGGIKTTTFTIIFATIWATLYNKKNTIIAERKIPAELVRRSFTIFFLSIAVISTSIFLLNATETFSIFSIAFEAVSAFGTVGLTTGITPYLTYYGKITIIITAFLGKVGALSVLMGLSGEDPKPLLEYPKEGVSIG